MILLLDKQLYCRVGSRTLDPELLKAGAESGSGINHFGFTALPFRVKNIQYNKDDNVRLLVVVRLSGEDATWAE